MTVKELRAIKYTSIELVWTEEELNESSFDDEYFPPLEIIGQAEENITQL
jgi:hypothetical protein